MAAARVDEILRVEKLRKRFNGFLLDIDEINFQRARIYGLTGPNGSGKTTLLSMLNLIDKPDGGELFYEGISCSRLASKLVHIRRKMAMVLENPYLFKTTVLKNVMYGLRVRGMIRKEAQIKARAALALVDMAGFADRKAQELSRGETQRVALSRAIVLDPEILFLDEPFTNIDKAHVTLVENLLRKLNRDRQMTIVLTTHDLFQAYRISDEVFSLVNGKVVKGSIENLHSGTVIEQDGEKFVLLDVKVKLQVSTDKKGRIHLIIPPEDIILSKKRFESSARNVLQGSIKSIEIEGDTVRVVCNAGAEFVSLITKASFDRMQLTIGSELFLTFKTTSVKVF